MLDVDGFSFHAAKRFCALVIILGRCQWWWCCEINHGWTTNHELLSDQHYRRYSCLNVSGKWGRSRKSGEMRLHSAPFSTSHIFTQPQILCIFVNLHMGSDHEFFVNNQCYFSFCLHHWLEICWPKNFQLIRTETFKNLFHWQCFREKVIFCFERIIEKASIFQTCLSCFSCLQNGRLADCHINWAESFHKWKNNWWEFFTNVSSMSNKFAMHIFFCLNLT